MRILIVGAGSIGIYLGTLLNKKNHEVSLLGRSKLKKIHDSILIGNKIFKVPKKIFNFPKNQEFDWIFISSKLYDLERNLKELKKKNISSKYLVSIQNGIVDNSKYGSFLKDYLFTTLSIFEGFRLVENQLVVSSSKNGWRTDYSFAGKAVKRLLKGSGINCVLDKNLLKTKAEKMIMNCSINVLCAIEKKTFYEMCQNKKIRKRIDLIFNEVYEVLNKAIKLRSIEKMRNLFYNIVEPMKHYSSTYQDAVNNKKTEVDFLNGYIIKKGKEFGVDVSENEKLLNQFKEMFK